MSVRVRATPSLQPTFPPSILLHRYRHKCLLSRFCLMHSEAFHFVSLLTPAHAILFFSWCTSSRASRSRSTSKEKKKKADKSIANTSGISIRPCRSRRALANAITEECSLLAARQPDHVGGAATSIARRQQWFLTIWTEASLVTSRSPSLSRGWYRCYGDCGLTF